MAVKIVTDNCCDLPAEMISELGLEMIHMLVRFGVKEFLPELLDPQEFVSMMETASELPTTSQPTIEEMKQVYARALADGSDVLAIHFSSGLSGTYQSTLMVKEELEGGERLHILDSRKASTGVGLMAVEAARMARDGTGLQAILARMEEMRERVRCVFTLNTLEYLVKGGRISKTSGLAGTVLDIKPILHIDQDGMIVPLDKIRGRKASMRQLERILTGSGAAIEGKTVAVSHVLSENEADHIRNLFLNELGAREVISSRIGPVIGSHVGRGTVAVFFES